MGGAKITIATNWLHAHVGQGGACNVGRSGNPLGLLYIREVGPSQAKSILVPRAASLQVTTTQLNEYVRAKSSRQFRGL